MGNFVVPDRSRPLVYTDAPCSVEILEVGIKVSEPCNAVILFNTADLTLPEQDGPLSIRCAFNGQRYYEADGGRFAVDDSAYLLLNQGRRYTSYIQSDVEVESFHICFWPSFAEEILRSLITPDDKLLDEPAGDCSQPIQFFENLYPHDDILSPGLFRLRTSVGREWATHAWLQEQNHLLLERLLQVHRNVCRQIEGLPAVRRATRTELYRRMHRARDFIDASLGQPISLHQIAEAAWFSPHHFLRLFKEVFGETPHQYLTRRRIDRAQNLLRRTRLSVTEIGSRVGFESIGSFSWMFRRHVGASPEQFRQQIMK